MPKHATRKKSSKKSAKSYAKRPSSKKASYHKPAKPTAKKSVRVGELQVDGMMLERAKKLRGTTSASVAVNSALSSYVGKEQVKGALRRFSSLGGIRDVFRPKR